MKIHHPSRFIQHATRNTHHAIRITHHAPRTMSLFMGTILLLGLMIANVPSAVAASKRVAVLYFEDHSRFDSPTGCGFIPTWPFNKIFGSGKGRSKWHLKDGFRELLNRKLQQTQVYEPVPQAEIMDAMARLGSSKKALQADAHKRAALANALKVDALIVGDVRTFNQEKVKANASRTLREAGQQEQRTQSSFVGGVQILGYFYRATVQLDMQFYGTSGNEIDNPKISASRNHQLGGARVAALEAIVTEEGTELNLGQMPNPDKKVRPIVETAALNKIEFGGPEFDRTLFGLTTDEALGKVVLALRESIGPEVIASDTAEVQKKGGDTSSQSVSPSEAIEGVLIYVDANDPEKAYINIGSAKGIAVRQQLTVYTPGEPLVDPSTGEVLGYVPQEVGTVEVIDVQTDRLSRVRVIEGLGVIKKGDTVRGRNVRMSK